MPIKVKRRSDGEVIHLKHVHHYSFVHHLHEALKNHHGANYKKCNLFFNEVKMHDFHELKHYGVKEDDTIDMDDGNEWSEE